ncbi:MAG: nitrogen regulation protein NR(I) [Gammaproteobacteria bacterium]
MNASAPEVWVVDDDSALRWVIQQALTGAGYRSRNFADAEEVTRALAAGRPDCLIADLQLPGEGGLELLGSLHAEQPTLPVIVVTAHSDLQSAVAAYQGGAFEYLPKPFDVDELLAMLARALQHAVPPPVLAQTALDDDRLLGDAPAMQAVFRMIGRLAGTQLNVLITGETGTGKELVARALHRHSPRQAAPFVAINTAAIPAELLESELFGHERGAFTGANTRRRGRFEQADGGSLFLDEIGDMPLDLQTRLLRVLAEGEFYRVGGHETLRVDVRVIAATHQNLEGLVARGRFREDLYYRLNVVRLQMPPLRERRADIPLLLAHFMDSAARELGLEPKRLTTDAMQALQARPWPGNVRELRNVCRRLTLMAAGRIVHKSDVQEISAVSEDARHPGDTSWQAGLRAWVERELEVQASDIAERAQTLLERTLIDAALASSGGKRQAAAKRLGIGRNTLSRKLAGK